MSEPERLFTAEELIELNREVLGYGGGRHGDVRYMSGLLYALDRPWLAFQGAEPIYPEPHDKAAALMEIIIRTHPFVDGNKRTAFVAGATLLRMLSGQSMDVPLGVKVFPALADNRIRRVVDPIGHGVDKRKGWPVNEKDSYLYASYASCGGSGAPSTLGSDAKESEERQGQQNTSKKGRREWK